MTSTVTSSTTHTEPLVPTEDLVGEQVLVLVLVAALRAGEHVVVHGVLADRRPTNEQVARAAASAGTNLEDVAAGWLAWLPARHEIRLGRSGVARAAHLLGLSGTQAMTAWDAGSPPLESLTRAIGGWRMSRVHQLLLEGAGPLLGTALTRAGHRPTEVRESWRRWAYGTPTPRPGRDEVAAVWDAVVPHTSGTPVVTP